MNVIRVGSHTVQAREHLGAVSKSTWSPAEKKLREAAGQLVSQAFFAPMLQQMRNSPFKDGMTSGGRGGEAFGQMLDGELLKKMANGTDRLSNSIVKQFIKRATAVEETREAKRVAAEGAAPRATAYTAGQEVASHVDYFG